MNHPIIEGDFVHFDSQDGKKKFGRVEYVMKRGSFGLDDSRYNVPASRDNPVLLVRLFEDSPMGYVETELLTGSLSSDAMRHPDGEPLVMADQPAVTMSMPEERSIRIPNPYQETQAAALFGGKQAPPFGSKKKNPMKGKKVAPFGGKKANPFSAKARAVAAEKGFALSDGKLPIRDEKELKSAIMLRGKVEGHSEAQIKKHIMKRAKALDMMDALPDEWTK
jgi:hypothetical protein